MAGTDLAQAVGGTIRLDADAAGWGWGRMDLFSVLVHELGHVLGRSHQESGPMVDTLAPGERLVVAGARTATTTAATAATAAATGGPGAATATRVLPVAFLPELTVPVVAAAPVLGFLVALGRPLPGAAPSPAPGSPAGPGWLLLAALFVLYRPRRRARATTLVG
jgi:hypothetical protein